MVPVGRTFGALFVLLAMAAGPCRADVARDGADCSDENSSAERVIEACSGVIDAATVLPDVKYAAYVRRATAFFESSVDFPRAIADASEAIKLRPAFANGYVLRGGMHLAYNEFDKAIADFNQAIKLAPGDAQALASRAYAYVQLGDSERAIADYSEVIRLRPDDANAHYDRGGAYEKQENFDRARADYNQAIKLQRDYAGEFQESCFAPSDKGERVLANWPACDGEGAE